MKITALDLSLTATGVAVTDPAAPYWRTFTIAPGSRTGARRLAYLQREIDRATDGAALVLREGYSFASQGRAITGLAELGGVVSLTMHSRRRQLVAVAPAKIKKLATGKGNAAKEAVLVEAVRRLGYRGSDSNQADALWLLQLALHTYRLKGAVDLPKTHRDAFVGMEWPAQERLT